MIDYKAVLNEQQYEAATTINGPLLIIAGAGTGKTATLIHRVAYMIENGIPPQSILLLTFTNKAANEMSERAAQILDERCNKITACTYHSFCAKMLRIYGVLVGLRKNFTILSESDIVNTIKLLIAENPEKYKIKSGFSVSEIAKIFSMSINQDLPLETVIGLKDSNLAFLSYIYTELFEKYKNYKKENNLVDYDDLLIYFNELLDNKAVRNQISSSYKYIMVDEYQDTNNLQERIIFKMAQKYENLAVVGDDYQSIYAFRGSNVSNFINFPKKHTNCKVIKLEKNYRSTTEILNLANSVMNRYANFGYPKNMTSNNKQGNMPEVISLQNQAEEATCILNRIIKLHNKNVPYKDIAVLEKYSRDSAILETLLMNNNIPYKKVGGPKFFEREAVQDILAYLRVIANPIDTLAWFRILQLIYGIGDTYARNIVEHVTEKDFLLHEYPTKKFHQDMEKLHNTILNFRIKYYRNQLSIPDLVLKINEYYIEQRKELLENAKLNEEQKINEQDKLDDDKNILKQLYELCTVFNHHKSLNAFLDNLTLGMDNKDEEEGLVISTVHLAKGLEWEYVFVLDCVTGVYPGFNAMSMAEEERQENLRVFYVAITRAKKQMYLCVPEIYHERKVYLTPYLKHLNNHMSFSYNY